jgi:23S rRNA pseudouridine1911/1915/1917 synthase
MIINGQVEPNSLFTFIVDESSCIQRIDQYLSNNFSHYSRTFFQKLIEEKCVSRNGIITTKSSTPIVINDTITIQFPLARIIEPGKIMDETSHVSVLETTQHFMIVYKPPYLLVHPPSKTSTAITLTDWITHNHQEISQIGIVDRPGIVHRLDKDTSGIMIITRTNHAHTIFNNLFKERKINKTYLAIVEGHPEQEGTINLAIARDPFNRIKMTTFSEEANHQELCKKHSIKIRHALTHYKVLRYFKNTSLVEIKPTTGRTHQIRVHMTAIGHPIVGDQTYGQKSALITRQALHAYRLHFIFDNQEYDFSSPLPHDMQQILDAL